MAHGTANEVIIWDFSGSGPSGKRPQTLGPFETEVVEVLYQNSGKVLCSAGRDGVLLFWNPSESSQPIFISGIRDQEISNFEWAPDDSFLFVGFTSGYVALIPSSLIFKNLAL
jgi:WD40 repeat protein